jgi:acetyl esterase/lipase
MSFDGNPRLTVRRLPTETYAAPDGVPLHVDVYLPEGTEGPRPAIVWIHGGGWRFGNRHVAPDLSRFFAARGFAMVSIDYRLSSQALFPAQIQDVRTAIRWLRRAGPALGIATDRIGLWGASAGGHLAALAALAPDGCFRPSGATGGDRDGAVQAVAMGYGPTDFLQMDAHRPPPGTSSLDPESLLLPRLDMRSADADSYESLLLGAPIDTCPELVQAANPIVYAGNHAPPFLILHGSCDTTVAPHQSELLYTALAEAGAEVTLALIEGVGHGFLTRSHLDDRGPRRAAIRHHPAGGEETSTTQDLRVFPAIEAFFRDALDPA